MPLPNDFSSKNSLKMKLSNLKCCLVLVLCSLFINFGCNKTELIESSDSGLTVLGNETDIELVTIETDPNGGFVVGFNSRTFDNKQIRVSKYNDDFNLDWEKYLGGPMSNKLFKLHFDRSENLVVAGLTYGYGADSFSLSGHKFWWPYLAVLDVHGDTLWGKGIEGLCQSAGSGSGLEERITTITQDAVGNYLLAGETAAFGIPIRSTAASISPTGDFIARYTADTKRLGKIDAFLLEDTRYTSFGYWKESDTTPAYAGIFKNYLNDTSGSNNYIDVSIGSWPFGDTYDVGIIGTVQHQPNNGIWNVDYIFSDACYRYAIDLSSGDISGKYINFPFQGIRYVKRNDDNSLLMADETGVVYDCDNDYQPKLSFKTGWNIEALAKLTNGEFVIGTHKGKKVYLIHYTENGKVIQND